MAERKEDLNIVELLKLLCEETSLSYEYLEEKIIKGVNSALKNAYNTENIIVNLNKDGTNLECFIVKNLVETVNNPNTEITLEEVKKLNSKEELSESENKKAAKKDSKKLETKEKTKKDEIKAFVEGDIVKIAIETKEFSRVAAMAAKNVIKQGIKDGENELNAKFFSEHLHDVLTATVEKTDQRTGSATLKIGKADIVIPKGEQIPGEKYIEGQTIKIYVADVVKNESGSRVYISRTNKDFVAKLFSLEVPEITDGVVSIVAVAREPGARSKIAVKTSSTGVDAVGACIGAKGKRISAIVSLLNGEKIDVIEYSDDATKYVSRALSPADVVDVHIVDLENKVCVVSVPDMELSLAIGNRGINARLAAKLTGWKIDIKSKAEYDSLDFDSYDKEYKEKLLAQKERTKASEEANKEANENETEAKDENLAQNAFEDTIENTAENATGNEANEALENTENT